MYVAQDESSQIDAFGHWIGLEYRLTALRELVLTYPNSKQLDPGFVDFGTEPLPCRVLFTGDLCIRERKFFCHEQKH